MGKTEIALEIMRRTKAPTLVVAPVKDLMHQWHRRIVKAAGYDAGVIGDRERNVRDISVTTYASACLHMEEFGDRFELIIFDECHHLTGSLRIDAARMSAAPYRLGLTATPRGTKQGNADSNVLIGPVCYKQKRSEVRGKHIANYATAVLSIELTGEERQRYGELGNVVREYIVMRRQEDPRWEWPSSTPRVAATRQRAKLTRRGTPAKPLRTAPSVNSILWRSCSSCIRTTRP